MARTDSRQSCKSGPREIELDDKRPTRPASKTEEEQRGARVAETGTLVPRSRRSSQSLAPTTEVPYSVEDITAIGGGS